ncbi:MAG: LTA synthase family protein [Clostridia bacterium]|nr:LTA synthase family protein [Clostridia bacterium]
MSKRKVRRPADAEERRKAVRKKKRRRRYDRTGVLTRLVLLPVLALAVTMIVESLSRGSVGRMFGYMTQRPLYFLYNFLIILTTLTVSEVFKHRRSVLFFVTVAWLALGVAARLVVKQRTQPFTSMDILSVKDAITLTPLYYTWPQIILMYGGIFLAVVAVGWILTRLPRRKRVRYWPSCSLVAGLVIMCICIRSVGLTSGWFPRYFENLVDSYDQLGFATCFTFTFGNMGISQPEAYSGEVVSGILEEVDSSGDEPAAHPHHVFTEKDHPERPNIIIVQMESLFDVNTIIGATYSEDPTPNFNRLSREYASGELYVPSIGGGTCNVEFEVLTGMDLDFFGVGETPYTTVLQSTTCESVAYALRDLGYCTTAMHNHTATFYSRPVAYSHLGFEHFVSVEYMPYVTYTDVGWAEDSILPKEILKSLRASEDRDLILTVTVESHGKYDENYVYKDGDPLIMNFPESLSRSRFANYLHLIHKTDAFIGQLVEQLDSFDEPVVCVFYGDHLPALDLTAELLTTGNLYASRYVVWNNYGAHFDAPDLQAYRMSANLLKQLGISGGVISRYHQAAPLDADSDQDYLDKLQVLQYDLLYGDKSSYENGENPYQPVDLMMGSQPISISSISTDYGRVLVNGLHFTERSVIYIDDTPYPTGFISSAQLIAIVPRTQAIGSVSVVQIALDGSELSRTDPVEVGRAAA